MPERSAVAAANMTAKNAGARGAPSLVTRPLGLEYAGPLEMILYQMIQNKDAPGARIQVDEERVLPAVRGPGTDLRAT